MLDKLSNKQTKYITFTLLSTILLVLLLLINPIMFPITLIISIAMMFVLFNVHAHSHVLSSSLSCMIWYLCHDFIGSIIVYGLITIILLFYPIFLLMVLLSVSVFYLLDYKSIMTTKKIINKYYQRGTKTEEYISVGGAIICGFLALELVYIIVLCLF